jgi:hypothetical protein
MVFKTFATTGLNNYRKQNTISGNTVESPVEKMKKRLKTGMDGHLGL